MYIYIYKHANKNDELLPYRNAGLCIAFATRLDIQNMAKWLTFGIS